ADGGERSGPGRRAGGNLAGGEGEAAGGGHRLRGSEENGAFAARLQFPHGPALHEAGGLSEGREGVPRGAGAGRRRRGPHGAGRDAGEDEQQGRRGRRVYGGLKERL